MQIPPATVCGSDTPSQAQAELGGSKAVPLPNGPAGNDTVDPGSHAMRPIQDRSEIDPGLTTG